MNKTRQTPQTAEQPLWQTIVAKLQSKLEPGLYIVATPIGHLSDITLRALNALSLCDVIYCEDTRVTKKLLAAYNIRKTMHAYHDHNAARRRPQILKRLQAGQAVCLVSDAGTPLISDPGYRLVKDAIEHGQTVTSLPGACAPIVALTLSGLPTDRFCFAGFLPTKSGARKRVAADLAAFSGTLIFFESSRRLARSLGDLCEILGPRPAVIARELTKRFEQLSRGPLDQLAAAVAEAGPPKGEVVILVGPAENRDGAADDAEPRARAALVDALKTLSTKDAAAQVARRIGLPRKQVYDMALALKDRRSP